MRSGTYGKTKRPPYETPPSYYNHRHVHLLFTVIVQCWCLSMGFKENHWHWMPSCLVMATESNPAEKNLPWAGKECRTAYTTLCGCTSLVLAAVDMFSFCLSSLPLSTSDAASDWTVLSQMFPKCDTHPTQLQNLREVFWQCFSLFVPQLSTCPCHAYLSQPKLTKEAPLGCTWLAPPESEPPQLGPHHSVVAW